MKHTNITEIAKKWGVSRRFMYNALEAGRIPGAEFIDGKWYIPEDAENPIKRLVTIGNGYLSAKQAAEKWGVSKKAVCSAAKTGRIPGAELFGGRWHIPENVENPIKTVMSTKAGYISTKEAAAKWGVQQTTVCNAAKEGRIPGAEFIGGRWHIPEDLKFPIDGRTSGDREGYTTVQKTADRWGISKARVHQFCQEGRIPGAVYEKKHWRVPVDAEKPVKYVVTPGFLSAAEIARRWGVEIHKLMGMCQAGAIPGVEHVGSRWFIPEDAVYPLEGYITAHDLAEKWGTHRQCVWKYCNAGRIPGAKRIGRTWYVPADAKKPFDMKTNRKPGYTSAAKAAEKWGIPRQTVWRLCREGRIPGAEHIDGKWHIPEDATRPERKGKNNG